MKRLNFLATIGPGRRANVTIVEMELQLEPTESDRLAEIVQQLQMQLPRKWVSLGLPAGQGQDRNVWDAIAGRPSAVARLAGFACHTALALQRKAGLKVQFEGFLQDLQEVPDPNRFSLIFEHDDPSTGCLAGDLAMRILSDCCAELGWEAIYADAPSSLEHSVEAMLQSARELVTSPDVLDLLAAARKRGIPVLRLERDPYEPVQAKFRVAPNGLIMLGQSCHQVLIDGLFCIQRPGPGLRLMQDRRVIWSLAAELGVPGPAGDMDFTTCATVSRARRAARRIAYPVRVWPVQRDPAAPEGWPVSDEAGLEALFARPGFADQPVMVEPEPQEPALDLVFANGRLVHAMGEGNAIEPEPLLLERADRIVRAVNTGLLWLRFIRVETPGEDPMDARLRYRLIHLDPAPSLVHVLAGNEARRREAIAGFLDWVYPPGAPSTIPIIAVTGSNGKTTTTTMLSRIAQAAGWRVGMTQTNGVYLDRELIESGDLSAFIGHCRVFENREANLAVLETARGGIITQGFAYDRCDVAVCTNVTAEHLGQQGIDTVAQLTAVKRSLLERAARAVVLNGDDPNCIAMLPFLTGKVIYLSTFDDSPGRLRARTLAEVNVINVEEMHGQDWIVLHECECQQGRPVIAVGAIPATFRGIARHNVSNAMHAIAAARAAGIEVDAITHALCVFEMSFESLPGRLNLHDNGRFHILMDYAHNADGIRQLVKFTDQLSGKGRKIFAFGVSPEAVASAVLEAAAAAAGHFDQYVCVGKPDVGPSGFTHPEILQHGLMANNVPEDRIATFTNPDDSFDYAVGLCEAGDLLVMVSSRVAFARNWQKILATH
jgi:UDP-N-acetylmuramate-alanine ligase